MKTKTCTREYRDNADKIKTIISRDYAKKLKNTNSLMIPEIYIRNYKFEPKTCTIPDKRWNFIIEGS